MDIETVDKLLTTTRTVRKRLDLTRPVPLELIERCLEIATQAPCGADTPRYHFVVITETELKAKIGEMYRNVLKTYWDLALKSNPEAQSRNPKFTESVNFLAEHMHEVPVLVQFCVECIGGTGRRHKWNGFDNIFPAVWSFMLALRARGLGAAWTTFLSIENEEEMHRVLGIPDELQLATLVPVAYYTGDDFRPAKRIPAQERTHWNGWGK